MPLLGCFFHFRQAIRRKLGIFGLVPLFNKDQDFQLQIKRLISLAFVPNEKVCNVFIKSALS